MQLVCGNQRHDHGHTVMDMAIEVSVSMRWRLLTLMKLVAAAAQFLHQAAFPHGVLCGQNNRRALSWRIQISKSNTSVLPVAKTKGNRSSRRRNSFLLLAKFKKQSQQTSPLRMVCALPSFSLLRLQ